MSTVVHTQPAINGRMLKGISYRIDALIAETLKPRGQTSQNFGLGLRKLWPQPQAVGLGIEI